MGGKEREREGGEREEEGQWSEENEREEALGYGEGVRSEG